MTLGNMKEKKELLLTIQCKETGKHATIYLGRDVISEEELKQSAMRAYEAFIIKHGR